MAITKYLCLFLKRKALDTPMAASHDTIVCAAKIAGIIANSPSLSAVSCEASLVKTAGCQQSIDAQYNGERTQTRGKQLRIQVGQKFLRLGVEHALPGDYVPGQADTDDFHDSLEDEEDEVTEVGLRLTPCHGGERTAGGRGQLCSGEEGWCAESEVIVGAREAERFHFGMEAEGHDNAMRLF